MSPVLRSRPVVRARPQPGARTRRAVTPHPLRHAPRLRPRSHVASARTRGSHDPRVTVGSPYQFAFLVAISLALVGCSGNDPDSTPRERPLLALLTNGELLNGTMARLGDGLRLTKGTLRPMSGRLMAVMPERRLVAVLLAASRSRSSEVVVLTTRGLRVRARLQLPVDRKTRATTLVAPVPDRLVVLGERETRAGGRLPVGWVIDIPSGDLLTRWSIPKAARGNWTVLDAAVAADARRLYLSYHGTCDGGPGRCTTGVDVASWRSGRLLCRTRRHSTAGCIAAMHGEVAAVPGGLLGTRGDDQSVLLANEHAQIVDRWSTRLARNHLMRLAYDPASRRVFALGSCLYAGGLARIDLGGRWRWRRGISSRGRPSICGERMAASRGLVVFTEGPEWAGGHESEITVVDAETGLVRARLPISVPAVDLVLVG